MFEERLDAEVGERASEEDRRQLAGVDEFLVELRIGAVEKFNVLEQLVVELPADAFLEGRVVEK